MLLTNFYKLARGKIWGLLVLIPIASGIEISVSYLLQAITDAATGKGRFSYAALVTIVIIYILADAAIYFISSYLQQTTLNKIINSVRNKLLNSLFSQRTGIGQNVQSITNDYYNDFTETVDVLRNDYLQGSFIAYKQICQLIIALTLSIMIKPALTFIIVLLCIPGIFLPFYQQNNLKQNKQVVLKESKLYTSQLQDVTSGLHTIQIFNIQAQLQKLFQGQNQKLLIAQNNDQLTRKKIGGISQFMNDLLYLGTWIIGIYFVMNKEISLGQLVAFSQLMIFISEPIQTASGIFGDIIGGQEAARKISKKLQPDSQTDSGEKLTSFQSLSYQDLSFEDHQQTILNHLNLDFETPKHYLLVGKSGSGKSTLLNLPFSNVKTTGQILVNEQPVQNYSIFSLYQNLGVLEQQAHIFDASVKDNLTLFNDNYSLEQCVDIMKQVGLDKYANNESLQKQINSQSKLFSGGEKRRLALGRLLLRHNGFNLFDEPLTGVDPKTSKEISHILTELKSGWIIVTHQYDEELFHNADSIVVLDNGAIKATGKLNDITVTESLQDLNLLN